MMSAEGSAVILGLKVSANVLVSGASSGIGLAMVRELLTNANTGRIFAVSRSASSSELLNDLARANSQRLQLIDVDLTREEDLERLKRTLDGKVESLHLVIHAAGLLHDAGLQPEKRLEQLTLSALQRVFAINAFAPALLAKALMPWLTQRQPSVFASISARVGSIGDNRAGGWYAYRASKAAQNQLIKTLSVELARRNPLACCLLLHPGTVATPLSEPFRAGVPAEKLFSTEQAAAQLLTIIARCSAEDSGRFLAWDGSDIPW